MRLADRHKPTEETRANVSQSIKRVKELVASALKRRELYQKHSERIVDPKAKVLKASDGAGEAQKVIDKYLSVLEKDPEKLQEVAQRLPEFLQYFGTARPTHTTSFNSLARMALSGKLLSGNQVREFHKELIAEEIAPLKSKLERLRPGEVADIHQRVIKPALAGLQKRVDFLEAKVANGKPTDTLKNELEAFKKYAAGLEGAFEFMTKYMRNDPSLNSLKDKVKKNQESIKFVTEAIEALRSATAVVGLNNSTDARVGVDTKVFVAMHNTSRYHKSFPRSASLVFKRDVLAEAGSSITMVNACEYVAPKKDKKTDKYDFGVHNDLVVSANDMLNGKGVLHNLDDPKTVMALALNAAYHSDFKSYMARYINETPDVNPGTATKAEYARRKEAGETMAKPVDRVEGHLEGPADFNKVEAIVFRSKEDADAFKELFPEHASKVDWNDDPDEMVALHADGSTVPESPFQLVEGNYIVRR